MKYLLPQGQESKGEGWGGGKLCFVEDGRELDIAVTWVFVQHSFHIGRLENKDELRNVSVTQPWLQAFMWTTGKWVQVEQG